MYFHREAEDLLLSSLITTVPEPKDSSPLGGHKQTPSRGPETFDSDETNYFSVNFGLCDYDSGYEYIGFRRICV